MKREVGIIPTSRSPIQEFLDLLGIDLEQRSGVVRADDFVAAPLAAN